MSETKLITLTTDFGYASPYVAAMKGVILSIDPDAAIHDLSHGVPPQGVAHARYFVSHAVPYFPEGSVHVIVVDPGVGSDRRILLVESQGRFLLAPDNGLLTPFAEAGTVRAVTERRWWRDEVSMTFHGRDVFSPVAAHLHRGVSPEEFGPVITDWVRSPGAEPTRNGNGWEGEVIFIDDFGNVITNLKREHIPGDTAGFELDGHRIDPRRVETYSGANPGELIALFGSSGELEFAVVDGNAAAQLGVSPGAKCVAHLA